MDSVVLYSGGVKAARHFTVGRASLPAVCLLAVSMSFPARAAELTVTVRTGANPIARSRVTLMRAGSARGSAATPLVTGLSDNEGKVRLSYSAPPGDILYLLADGAPSLSVRLAVVVGAGAAPPSAVVVNELTTVATAFAMAQFLRNDNIGGASPGLAIAAMTASSLVNPATGEIPARVESAAGMMNTLANLLAACTQSKDRESCQDLFVEARPPSSATPANTLEAAHLVARFPAHNVVGLYHMAPGKGPYQPALSGSPDAWTLTIKHTGNGREFDGPENLAFDKDGNLWVTNRLEFGSAGAPGAQLIRLIPTGLDAPGAPYSGGGVSGASGIAIDPSDNVWLGNVAGNSVSRFDGSGKALSPAAGYRTGKIKHPAGVVVDPCGNLWVANGGTETITKYPAGDPERAIVFNDLGVRDPSGMAADAAGFLWAAGSANNRLAKFALDGKPAPGSPFLLRGISKPIEIAIDSANNAWVTNQNGHSVSMVRPDGLDLKTFPAGDGPWGIALDGLGNVYVTDYKRPGLLVLCGSVAANCPMGKQTGDLISPASGFTGGGLQRLTSVAIDMAGNVWVANNSQVDPKAKPNTGGDGLVEFIGLAAPVKTPRIGPVQQPAELTRACGAKTR